MEKVRYWISFDLGLRGRFEELYQWLDDLDAKECGDNVATFFSAKTREQLAAELSKLLNSDGRPRIYIIDRKHGGKFVLGRRKAAPWVGYSQRAVQSEEEK